MNTTAANMIAAALTSGGLLHPGDADTPPHVVALPGFKLTGTTDEQAAALATTSATEIAQATIALLETRYELIPLTDAQAMRAAAAEPPPGARIIGVYRHGTPTPLLEFALGNTDRLTYSQPQLDGIAAALTNPES